MGRGAWLGIGGGVTSGFWTAHPTIGWVVGAAAGYFIAVSIMFFLERWWGIHAYKDNRSGWETEAGSLMLTPRQEDLIKRFFVGISLLDGEGERQNADIAERVLHNCLTTDLIKSDELNDMTKCDPSIVERQHFVFQQLPEYCAHDKLSKRLSYVIAIFVFVFAVYQFFDLGWIWGLGTLVLVPIAVLVSYPVFLAALTLGFSPLAFVPA